MIYTLQHYRVDATLAASIVSGSSILWSEDRHLVKESVLAAALRYGVEINSTLSDLT